MKLYLANKMRGMPYYNWNWFEAAAKVCRAKGHEVVSPTEIDEATGVVDVERAEDGTILSVQLTSRYSFGAVIGRDLDAVEDCDAIVMGPDADDSIGARMELEVARANNLFIYYGVEDVPDVSCAFLSETAPDPHGIDFDYPILSDEDKLRHAQRWSLPVEETRVVDPETGGAKGSKLARFDLLPPDAMWAVAEHFGLGARKYEDRNWEKGYAWGLSYAALQRHLNEFWAGEDIDEETGGFHIAAAAVHCLFLLAFQMRGVGTDDRTKVTE